MFARIGMFKYKGNEAFKRNLWSCVLVSLVLVSLSFVFESIVATLVTSGSSRYESLSNPEFYEHVFEYVKTVSFTKAVTKAIQFMMPVFFMMALTLCLQILFTNPLAVSYSRFFMENAVQKTEGAKVFFVFKNGNYPIVAWKMFWREVYIFGWTLLFVIPGIVKSYSYRLVPFLLAENPDLDRKRVFAISEQMMKGHRWEFFLLELSFIGWILLGALTRGITDVFYTNPYMQATYAEFYFERKEEAQKNHVFEQSELPVFEVKKGKVQMF